MIKRKVHPNKEIEDAVRYAESLGWEYKDPGTSSHTWGRLFCPLHTREGHIMSIYSTPRNTHNHAKQIRKRAECEHTKAGATPP